MMTRRILSETCKTYICQIIRGRETAKNWQRTYRCELLGNKLSRNHGTKNYAKASFGQVWMTSMTEKYPVFSEFSDRVLCLQNPKDKTLIKVVITESLRSRVLRLAHWSHLSGHPDQKAWTDALDAPSFCRTYPQISIGQLGSALVLQIIERVS